MTQWGEEIIRGKCNSTRQGRYENVNEKLLGVAEYVLSLYGKHFAYKP